MIFRTITDDITGANKSIGLFGKSLNDIKGIINSFKQNGFANTLLNTPLINIDTDAINRYNAAIRTGIPSEQALATARRTTNAETVALIESSHGLEIQTERVTAAQKASTIAAKAHSVALKAASIAGNIILFAAISKGIQLAITAIDNWIHRVEKARECTDKLFAEFKSMNDTLADHKKTVSELADRYDELSKGVSLSTNDNISLSTEEYEEFLDINEQMAQSFPELAKGIDENGNSILTLGTKGITAKEQLEELLQTEEDLNNFRIAQGLEEAFKGVYTYVEDANEATEKLNGTIGDSNEAMSKLQDIAENGIDISGENNQLIISGNTNNQAEFDYLNALTDSVNEFWEALDPERRVQFDPSTLFLQNHDQTTGAFELYANTYGLTSEEITELENIIRDNVGDASGALLDSISDQSQELQEQIKKSENAWTDFIPTLVSGMKSKQTFKNLDSDLQGIAIQIVEGLDYSYADAMKEWDPDPYAYVRDKIIDPLSKLDDVGKEKLTSSFEGLFTLDAENLSQSNQAEIEKFITTIATLLEKDPLEIRVALGFDIEDTQNRYNTALNKAKHQLGGYSYNDRGVEATNDIGKSIQDFWNENVITEEDWTLWEKVTAGIKDATAAMNAYTEAKKNANDVELNDNSFIPTISSSIQQLATQLEPQFTKLGEAYKDIFTTDGFTLDNVDNSMLDSLRESFAEIEEEIGVTFDASKLEPFFDTLTDSASTADQVQQAFNDLATAYLYSTETLEYLNEETAESIVKQLEEMGVANAQEVVYDALNEKTQELALEKQFLAETGKDVADATQQDIDEFLEEATTSGICAQELMVLALKKAAVNGVLLDTSADITNLLSLASAAGIATENLSLLARAKSGLVLAESQGNEAMVSYYTDKIGELAQKAQDDIFNFDKVNLDFNNVGGGKSGAGKAGKEAADEYLEAFEKELKELDELRDDGIISEKEYLDRLRALYNKYFKDKAKYLKQYAKYEKQYLNGMKDLYEKAFSHMTSQLDKRKDAINAERDARLADIEAQKEQYQHEIDLIDEQIKAKNKEIETIKSAANSRKLENEYMLAQYKLAQTINQRTQLVKIKMPYIIVI